MESPVDDEPVDSITEELERPLLDQFSTKNYSSDEYMSDTYVSEPMWFEDDPSMTTDATDVTLYASSCPDFECMRGTPVTEPITRSTRSCPSVICIRDAHVTEPMYEECSTMTSEIARDTYVTPLCTGDLESGKKAALQQPPQENTIGDLENGHEATPKQPPQQTKCVNTNNLPSTMICCLEGDHKPTSQEDRYQTEDLNMKGGHGSASFSQAQRQIENHDVEWSHEPDPQQTQHQTKNLSMEWGHGSPSLSPAQRQTENHDLEWGYEADPQQTQRQTKNLSMEWGHGSPPFSPAQWQTEKHDLEWGHEPDPQQTQRQTKVDDPASDMIYMVRLLLAMYMIVLPYLGWGHGSAQHQTENHGVEGGNEPDPQQTRRQTE